MLHASKLLVVTIVNVPEGRFTLRLSLTGRGNSVSCHASRAETYQCQILEYRRLYIKPASRGPSTSAPSRIDDSLSQDKSLGGAAILPSN
jgi:hypothetical protein